MAEHDDDLESTVKKNEQEEKDSYPNTGDDLDEKVIDRGETPDDEEDDEDLEQDDEDADLDEDDAEL